MIATYKYDFSGKTVTSMQVASVFTQSMRAKLLLDKVLFWMKHTTIQRDGKMWIAKSRTEWAMETTLTEVQVKKALTDLRSLGIVETRQGLFGGKNVTHLTLTNSAHLVVQKLLDMVTMFGNWRKYVGERVTEVRNRVLEALTRPHNAASILSHPYTTQEGVSIIVKMDLATGGIASKLKPGSHIEYGKKYGGGTVSGKFPSSGPVISNIPSMSYQMKGLKDKEKDTLLGMPIVTSEQVHDAVIVPAQMLGKSSIQSASLAAQVAAYLEEPKGATQVEPYSTTQVGPFGAALYTGKPSGKPKFDNSVPLEKVSDWSSIESKMYGAFDYMGLDFSGVKDFTGYVQVSVDAYASPYQKALKGLWDSLSSDQKAKLLQANTIEDDTGYPTMGMMMDVKDGKLKTVADILSAKSTLQKKQTKNAKDKFWAEWREQHEAKYGHALPLMSQKQTVQVKQILAKLDQMGVGDDLSRAMFVQTMYEKWTEVRETVKKNTLSKTSPERPHIGFILTHIDQAMIVFNKTQKTSTEKQVEQVVTKAVQTIAQGTIKKPVNPMQDADAKKKAMFAAMKKPKAPKF